ncbi:hypothetical protein D3C80_1515750 [compost metagenome]
MVGGDAERLLHGALEANLVDEDETPAGLQIGAVDGHHHLGRHLTAAGKGIRLVAAQAVLDDQGGVQRRGAEHGALVPVIGLPVLVIDFEQVQHPRGRGAATQMFQVSNGAISHADELARKT